MKRRPSSNQPGFALLLFVVTLMAAGGLLLIGFSEAVLEEAESNRFEHNKRVLEEAKQALLQSAYNYPVTNNLGPGRLPNADIDNDGIAGFADGGSTFGRLPWRQPNLNLYDIRDADGQRLWYAVSSSFIPQASPINSDTSGRITIRDQSGNIIFDGSNPAGLNKYGVAAVIIAPGAVIDRNGVAQDRSIANADNPFDTLSDTDPGIITASNYLDLVFGTEDNSGFTNSDADDGFILGPVDGLTNDQFIVITAAEVTEMAEKATLQAYQGAIDDYLGETANVYPYLFNHLTNCFGGTSTGGETTAGDCTAAGGTWRDPPDCYGGTSTGGETTEGDCTAVGGTWRNQLTWLYPAHLVFNDEIDREFLGACFGGAETNRVDCVGAGNEWKAGYKGRIPSLFAEYFTEATSVGPGIESTFEIEVTVDGGDFSGFIPYNQTFPVAASGDFEFVDQLWDSSSTDLYTDYDGFTAESITGVVSALRFEDLDPDVGTLDTKITGTFETDASVAWGGLPSQPNYVFFWDGVSIGPTGKWRKCETNGGHIDDCHVDGSGLPDVHGTGQLSIRLLRITAIELVFTAGESFEFHIDSSAANPVVNAADGSNHATITSTFAASEISLDAATIRVSYEVDNNYIDGGRDPSNFNVDESGTMDIRGFADPAVTLTFRYYPILPEWAFNNGWHDSILMAYSPEYLPGEDQACDAGVDCLEVRLSRGPDDNKIGILISAGQHDWIDDDGDGFMDDLLDVFEGENGDLDDIFEWPSTPGGDNMIILEP